MKRLGCWLLGVKAHQEANVPGIVEGSDLRGYEHESTECICCRGADQEGSLEEVTLKDEEEQR